MVVNTIVLLIIAFHSRVLPASKLSGDQAKVGVTSLRSSATPKYARTVVHEKEPGGNYTDYDTSGKAKDQVVAKPQANHAVSTHRNPRIFAVIVCMSLLAIAFATRAYLNRGKEAKPLTDETSEQSTLMSEILPRTENRWEKRGVIFGIVISLSALSTMAVNVSLMHPIYDHLDAWTKCDEGVFGMVWWESKFCVYTAAYIWTAPQLTVVATVLLFARGILQYRLYYALLKAGLVLDYHRSTALGDPLFLLSVWWYAHGVMYCGFLFYVFGYADPNALKDGRHKFIEGEINKIINLLTHGLIPFTVFIFFFFSKYTLEQSLVPLSEFVDATERQKHLLSSLSVLDESVARDVFEKNSKGSLLSDEADDQRKYTQAVQLCIERIQEKSAEPLQPSHLWNYLWPSTILLSRKTLGDNARIFRKFWWTFLTVAMILLVCSCAFTISFSYEELRRGRYMFLPAALGQIGIFVKTFEAFRKASDPLLAK